MSGAASLAAPPSPPSSSFTGRCCFPLCPLLALLNTFPFTKPPSWAKRLVTMELNLFLTAFSALPGRSLDISDHLFPNLPCASHNTTSSPPVHALFRTLVSRWFNQRSRHCLPDLPGNCVAIRLLGFHKMCAVDGKRGGGGWAGEHGEG